MTLIEPNGDRNVAVCLGLKGGGGGATATPLAAWSIVSSDDENAEFKLESKQKVAHLADRCRRVVFSTAAMFD